MRLLTSATSCRPNSSEVVPRVPACLHFRNLASYEGGSLFLTSAPISSTHWKIEPWSTDRSRSRPRSDPPTRPDSSSSEHTDPECRFSIWMADHAGASPRPYLILWCTRVIFFVPFVCSVMCIIRLHVELRVLFAIEKSCQSDSYRVFLIYVFYRPVLI